MDEKIVILDRDGVINKESHAYIKSPNEWHPIEGSIEGIALLTQADFTITVATNQSGLGRGFFNKSSLDDIHKKMNILSFSRRGFFFGFNNKQKFPWMMRSFERF